MIVDTSAVLAVINGEADAEHIAAALATADTPLMSAATYVETAIVVDAQRDPVRSRLLDRLLREARIVVADVTSSQAEIARAAYRDFGKGAGHRAGLNYGDCFAYALAKERDEPLLFKGDDFVHTDVLPAT